MSDKITMDGEYAYRRAPTERVRILCVDRPGCWPVAAMMVNGNINPHRADGRHAFDDSTNLDLIPLQRPRHRVRGWVNVSAGGGHSRTIYATRACADLDAGPNRIACVRVEECDPPEGQE